MSETITVVHYWAGCPKSTSSKWQRFSEVIKRCRQQGWKNYLVWSKMPDNPKLVKPFEKAGCEIILQSRSCRNFDFGSIWRTYKLMRRLKCDVFHCHNDHTSPLIGAALVGVPVRIWSKLAMSSNYERNEKPKGLHRFMPSTRISCLCAHKILAISDRVRAELIDSVGFSKKIETVYVPVDFEKFAIASDDGIREELKLKPSDIVITSVGQAIPVKGWDIAIKAFEKVYQKFPETRLLLVGERTSSQYFDQLIKLVKEYSIEEAVCFTGNRDDIPQILKISDIFILPSRSEGMPAALVEALAAGLPCIASNVGGVPEVITHEKDGLLFEREISRELAESIIRLIKDKSLRKKFAFQATVRAREFGMEVYAEKVFKAYETLLSRKTNTITQDERTCIRT